MGKEKVAEVISAWMNQALCVCVCVSWMLHKPTAVRPIYFSLFRKPEDLSDHITSVSLCFPASALICFYPGSLHSKAHCLHMEPTKICALIIFIFYYYIQLLVTFFKWKFNVKEGYSYPFCVCFHNSVI